MNTTVVVLRSAEEDIREIRRYLIKNFGLSTWQDSRARLMKAIRTIGTHPASGKIPDELAALNLMQYREVLSGMNRVIYEVRADTAFVHVICDTRKDLRGVLMNRILRLE